MPVRYDKPEDAEPGTIGFWSLPPRVQATLRPPAVVVVAPVPEQRRKGRIEAERLHDWAGLAEFTAGTSGDDRAIWVDLALLERMAELLRAITANPALPVTVGRKPVAKATLATEVQRMFAAAGRDQRCLHDLVVAGPNGREFLRDLCAFPWTDDGEAAARIFASTVSCADDDVERAMNRIGQEGDPGAAVRHSSKPDGDPFHRDHTPDALRRSTEIARSVAEALDPLTGDRLDQIPPLLARELARVVLRDRREVDLRLKASLGRREDA